jgi:hypothetical protein
MKHGKTFIQKQSPARRFFFPMALVLGIWLLMKLFYENAWKLNLGEAQTVVAWGFGLGNELFRPLVPIIAYPIAYFRGASLTERALACLMPFFVWFGYQLFLAAGVFSIGETVYYGFSSAFLFALCNVISVMGVCEFFCRWRVQKRDPEQKIWSFGAGAAVLSGPVAVFVLMIWGGGTHWFYVYQEGYKLLFH